MKVVYNILKGVSGIIKNDQTIKIAERVRYSDALLVVKRDLGLTETSCHSINELGTEYYTIVETTNGCSNVNLGFFVKKQD